MTSMAAAGRTYVQSKRSVIFAVLGILDITFD